MKPDQITKFWAAICLVMLAVVLDAWLATLNAKAVFGTVLPVVGKYSTATIGGIIVGPLYLFQIKIAHWYHLRTNFNSRSRYPIPFLEIEDYRSSEARSYSRLLYFLIQVLPLLAFLHFNNLLTDASYVDREQCRIMENDSTAPVDLVSVWKMPQEKYDWTDGYRLQHCKGITYFPVFYPFLLVAILFLCCFYQIRFELWLRQHKRMAKTRI